MNNKLFGLMIVLILLPFFAWMYYDSRNDAQAVQKDGAQRDLLVDGKGDAPVPIEYVFRFPAPVYSHDLNTSQIEDLIHSGGEAEHYHIYGLTQAGYSTSTQFEVNWSKKWFKSQYSVWVENLRVEFTYDTLNVFVTSAYPEGSCPYQATLDHENQHVDIHRRIYEQYQKAFKDALGQSAEIPTPSHPVITESVEEGKKLIGEKISGVLDPLFDQFKETMGEEQGKLDTPENYAALKAKCQGW